MKRIVFPTPYQHPPLKRTEYGVRAPMVFGSEDMTLGAEDWRRLLKLIADPPAPTPALRALLRRS